jgi:sulfite reductase (NADPH) flavoprotein alpha-component
MLVQNKLQAFLELVSASTKEELIWMNGYLSGLVNNAAAPQAAAPVKAVTGKITIAYGTETGHSKRLASDFASRAKQHGIQAKVVSLDQYRPSDLAKEEYFLTILSTHGEGEPPAAAKKFYDHIHQNGFKLEKLKYSVLALGDTAYPLFCKAGEDVDAQLNKLGGERIVSLQKCDTDYEAEADDWFNLVLQQLSGNTGGPNVNAQPQVTAKRSSGKKTYTGRLISNINLNDRGSEKQTHHIEIETDAVYLPGDSLGLVPENSEALVQSILDLEELPEYMSFTYRNESDTIFNLLQKKLNIVYLPERVIRQYAAIVQQDIPSTRMGLYDLMKIYPLTQAAQFAEVVRILEPITPRLYSISSSPQAHEGEVHLTVARDMFRLNEELKYGLCSDYLSCLRAGASLQFYIHPNDQFRLPADDKDIIMIGPGTGIAPFRSFLAEREASGATGRNWLFFGDRNFTSDFLYQTDIQNWAGTGLLSRVNVAFSRDQAEKIYVQHKMLEQGDSLLEWIDAGAYIYICGAKEPMSVDVENTLLYILKHHGNRSVAEAEEYFKQLKEEGRFLKDVY